MFLLENQYCIVFSFSSVADTKIYALSLVANKFKYCPRYWITVLQFWRNIIGKCYQGSIPCAEINIKK